MFPVVAPLLLPPIIIMDPAQSIKAVRGKSERNAGKAVVGVRISDDGSDLLSFSSSAKLSHNYELGIDFHNLATITQYYSIFSFNGNHIARESWERWGSGSCNIFSACH